MADWQPDLYLAFERQRTQPAIDLASRLTGIDPRRAIDLGCGPGNSTRVLKERWPGAQLLGVDNSQAMIEKARASDPSIAWLVSDCAQGLGHLGLFDVVFSNAALQWMPDHGALLPQWFSLVANGGILAVQVPNVTQMPVALCLKVLAASPPWRSAFEDMTDDLAVHDAGYYYDILSGLKGSLSLWQTDYIHVMGGHGDIVTFYQSTGLRPYLERLKERAERESFMADFSRAIQQAYPPRSDGRVLFPFTRVFFTLEKP